jgi:N-formylglutamate amidohydrolase
VESGDPRHDGGRHVEYLPGDLPIILSAPHDGALIPEDIPTRTVDVLSRDSHTRALVRATAEALAERTGSRPHVVLCHLARRKVEVNRPIDRATDQGASADDAAGRAWLAYHGCIEAAGRAVTARFGAGVYVDVHGHGHADQRLELGYLIRGSTLALPDAELSQPAHVAFSSVRVLAERTPERFAAMLRGPDSLGATLERCGFPSVPSPSRPHPAGAPYFNGGYSTARHGSRGGGAISAVQVEANWVGVRDSAEAQERFGRALAEALAVFFDAFVGVRL